MNTYAYYTSERLITSPWEPGDDVAFNKASGPPGLRLGTHNCAIAPIRYSGPFSQVSGAWRPVATTLPEDTIFCVYTNSISGNGDFTGTLGWDGIRP